MDSLPEHELKLAHASIAVLLTREAWMRSIIEPLVDRELIEPSLLPGWSVAHVLVHLARNADSHRRRIEAAPSGEMIDQYEGGAAGREREIEDGVQRRAREIVDDVVDCSLRLDAAWTSIADSHWLVESRDVGGKVRTLRSLPLRRLQEVEVHVVDLGIGVTQSTFSDALVAEYLEPMRSSIANRLPRGAVMPDATLDARDELWWLYGRGEFDGYPQLAPLGASTDRNRSR